MKDEDYFTIYYRIVELLDAFCDSLGHKSKIQLVLTAFNKKGALKMFPVTPLSIRDYYHHATFILIGKSNYIEITVTNVFIQFIRKQQIFAGISRLQLKSLEDAIPDSNKE